MKSNSEPPAGGTRQQAPLFDRDKPSEHVTSETIDGANAIVERFREYRRNRIVLQERGIDLLVPNLVRCYFQAHIRRCLMFVEAGAAEIDAGRPLAAELCTRAIYENIATICDLSDKIAPLCEAVDYAGVERLVTQAAFATRIPSFLEKNGEDLKASQILTQIDRMNKRYANFREDYDHQSDIVHPNGLGAFVYFGTLTSGVADFKDDGNNPDRARTALIAATILLTHAEEAIASTEQRLQKLSSDVIARDDPDRGANER
jgi:hypothetical protein